MLKTLSIENIAVIESAKIEFGAGLNVLTGETGAGKSIVVDAINTILGERASKDLVRHGADSAFVSAMFCDVNDVVNCKLREFGIDAEEDNCLLLTRKISSDGKSSCRINGKSVTVSMCREIGHLLVNIHGQHDSQSLLNPEQHFRFIDLLSGDGRLLSEYKNAFSELLSVRRKLKALANSEEDKDKALELLEYQIKELEAADIKDGEIEALQKRKRSIENREAMLKAYNKLLGILNGSDDLSGMLLLLSDAKDGIESFSSVSETAKNISAVLADAADLLETAKDSASDAAEALDLDEAETEKIEERLDYLYKLRNKYGNTEAEMLNALEDAKKRRNSILFDDEELEKLNRLYDSAYEKVVSLAGKLSAQRKKTAEVFAGSVKEQLAFLDMQKIEFIVDFQQSILSANGFDKIEFLISTNPGEPPKPLAKIASGGELSRIMLAIKNVIAYNDTVGTLIFDEIDSGVSGRASRKIGLKLKSVAQNTQVITVTHSAQIAAAANEHFLISKKIKDEKTYTNITPLDFNGRKQELSRIMGGLVITETLLKSAEELLLSEE